VLPGWKTEDLDWSFTKSMAAINYNQPYNQIRALLQSRLSNQTAPYTLLRNVMTEISRPAHGNNATDRKRKFNDLLNLITTEGGLSKVTAVMTFLNDTANGADLATVQKVMTFIAGNQDKINVNPTHPQVQAWLTANNVSRAKLDAVRHFVTTHGPLNSIRTISTWFTSRTISAANCTALLNFVRGLTNREADLRTAIQTVDTINATVGKSWVTGNPPPVTWANVALQQRTIMGRNIQLGWIEPTILSSNTDRSRSRKRFCENIAVAYLDLGLHRNMENFDTSTMANIDRVIIR